MDAPISRVLSALAAWQGSRVSVTLTWRRDGEGLAHMAGVLGSVTTREEPGQWEDDVRVIASVPIGEACWLAIDSHAIVEARRLPKSPVGPEALGLQLHDDLRVLVRLDG